MSAGERIIEALQEALAARRRELDLCPARKGGMGDKPCPKCGATTAGPCWLNVAADATVVDVVKELTGQATSKETGHG